VGELTPVPPRERVASLDVLRGLALLGVLLANLYVLYSFRFASHDRPSDSSADVVARWFMALFVHSRAQTLLTFLFGFGFAVQLVRAREHGRRVLPIYLRRLFALLAIGWCHVLLLSWVDVTWGYALTGFFLLAFTRAGDRANRNRLLHTHLFPVVAKLLAAIQTHDIRAMAIARRRHLAARREWKRGFLMRTAKHRIQQRR
jgi:uncharacterized protein